MSEMQGKSTKERAEKGHLGGENAQGEANQSASAGLSRRSFLAGGASVALGVSVGAMGWSGCDGKAGGTENPAPDGGGNPPEQALDIDPQKQQREADCKSDLSVEKGKEMQFAASSIAQDDKVFSLGVQAGVMASNSALLWSFAEDKASKHLRVWRNGSQEGKVIVVFDGEASPKDGYFHVPVEGLAAGMRYRYAFFDGPPDTAKGRSRIGSFVTAFPEKCLQPLTVAATACTHVRKYPTLKSLQYMAEQEAHVFCHMGDMSYNDGAKTRDEYDTLWRQTLKTPGYPEMLASTGIYATWDDHETTDNKDLYGLPPEHRKLAYDAYLDYVAQPRKPEGRFWGSYRWGLTAEFFVLDCRGERDEAKQIYISATQMDWLKKALKESPCHFKVVMNSVPIIAMPPVWGVVKDDRWDGFPKQRDELLDHITQNKIGNVWFLGGDYHIGVVAKIEKEGERSSMYEILVGPGGNQLPDIFTQLLGENNENIETFAPKEQFLHFVSKVAATMITFDPIENHVHVRFIDPETKQTMFDQKLKQQG